MTVLTDYAWMTIQRDRCVERDQPIPVELHSHMMEVEGWFASLPLTPQERSNVEQTIQTSRSLHLQSETRELEQQNQTDFAQAADKGMQELTKGIGGQSNGLSMDQYREYQETGAFNTPGNSPPSKKDKNNATRALTKSLDPAGQGFSHEDWKNRLDSLANANRESETKFQRIAEQYDADPDDLKRAAYDWEQNGLAQTMRERQDLPAPPEYVTLDAKDERRMDIRSAVLEHMMEADDADEYADSETAPIRDELMEDETRTGDIARAWDYHESVDAEDSSAAAG